MVMQGESVSKFRRATQIYHWFPLIAVIVLVTTFLATYYVIGSYSFASFVAGVPSALLLWVWSSAGRDLDQLGCPFCGRRLSEKVAWTYPPTKCPHCGALLRK